MKTKRILSTVLVAFLILLLPMEGLAATPNEYVNYELGNEITQIPVMFVSSKGGYPKEVDNKYIGWLSVDGVAYYGKRMSGDDINYRYINMIDVVNLYRDGAYREIAPKQHKFFFAGNSVIFNENSNTVSINGKSQYVGKIRYADTDKDKYRRGGIFGSKVTYDKSAVTIGTWIPAEALDDILQFGVQGEGNAELKAGWGVYVPDKNKKLVYKGDTYPSLQYSQMKAKLPENIKAQIKEPQWNMEFTMDSLKISNINGGRSPMTETIKDMETRIKRQDNAYNALKTSVLSTNNLLFGEDFSNVDNYDQVAKVVKALFEVYPDSTSYKEYRDLSEEELAEKFKEMSRNPETHYANNGTYSYVVRKLEFLDTTETVLHRGLGYESFGRVELTVYLSGREKQNGISFSIKPLKYNDETRNIILYILKDVYPYEVTETLIKQAMYMPTLDSQFLDSTGNKGMEKYNVVQATGKYKYFYGVLPEDKIYTYRGFLYFLIDNHPALPNERFFTPDYENLTTNAEGKKIYPWGRGFREDFFTFLTLPSEVRKSLGMPEIWDSIDYKHLTVSKEVREREGSVMAHLERCTNNPYDSYGKLSD